MFDSFFRCTGQTPKESDPNYSEPGNSSLQENATNLVENSFGRKLCVSVADAGETAIVVSMVTGDHSVEEPNAIPFPTIEVTQPKTETDQVTSEFGGDKTRMPTVEIGKALPKLEGENLEMSLSQAASFSLASCSSASSKLEENSDLHVQGELCMNSSQGSLGQINISSIRDETSDSNCGVDPHLEFYQGPSSSGNFAMMLFPSEILLKHIALLIHLYASNLILAVIIVNGMKTSGTENVPSDELPSQTPSENTLVKGKKLI